MKKSKPLKNIEIFVAIGLVALSMGLFIDWTGNRIDSSISKCEAKGGTPALTGKGMFAQVHCDKAP